MPDLDKTAAYPTIDTAPYVVAYPEYVQTIDDIVRYATSDQAMAAAKLIAHKRGRAVLIYAPIAMVEPEYSGKITYRALQAAS